MPVLDPNTAEALYAAGQIDDATYQSIVSPADPLASAQPLPPPEPDMIAGQNKTAAQQYLAEQAQGNVPAGPPLEVAPEDRVDLKPDWVHTVDDANQPPRDVMTQAVAKERDSLAASIEEKRNAFKLQGIPDKLIDEMLADDMAQLASYNTGPVESEPEAKVQTAGYGQLASDATGDTTKDVPDPYAFQAPGVATPGLDMQQAGAITGAQNAYEAGQQKADYIAGMNDRVQDQRAADYMEELQRQEQIDNFQQELDTKVDEVANMKVDTGRFWKNMSTGSKVASIIGVMLSGYAQGFTGRGGNPALSMLQNAISDDLAAQKADIANARAGVQNKRSLYGDMLRKFKDERVAEQATIAAMYENTENQIKELMARTESKNAKANLMVQLGEIETKKQAAKAEAMKRYQGMLMVRGAGPMAQTGHMISKVVPEKQQKQALEELSDWQYRQNASKAVGSNFERIKNETGNPLFNNPMGVDQARIEAFNANIFRIVKQAMGERFTDKDVEELVHPFQIKRSDVTEGRIDAKMDELQRMILDGAKTPTLEIYGLKPKNDREAVGFTRKEK